MVEFRKMEHSPHRSNNSLFLERSNGGFISEDISITIRVITNSTAPVSGDIICEPMLEMFRFEDPNSFRRSFSNKRNDFNVTLSGRIIVPNNYERNNLILFVKLNSGGDNYPPTDQLSKGKHIWKFAYYDEKSGTEIDFRSLIAYQKIQKLYGNVDFNNVLNDLGLKDT